jgi:hypothetical protein
MAWDSRINYDSPMYAARRYKPLVNTGNVPEHKTAEIMQAEMAAHKAKEASPRSDTSKDTNT